MPIGGSEASIQAHAAVKDFKFTQKAHQEGDFNA